MSVRGKLFCKELIYYCGKILAQSNNNNDLIDKRTMQKKHVLKLFEFHNNIFSSIF